MAEHFTFNERVWSSNLQWLIYKKSPNLGLFCFNTDLFYLSAEMQTRAAQTNFAIQPSPAAAPIYSKVPPTTLRLRTDFIPRQALSYAQTFCGTFPNPKKQNKLLPTGQKSDPSALICGRVGLLLYTCLIGRIGIHIRRSRTSLGISCGR